MICYVNNLRLILAFVHEVILSPENVRERNDIYKFQ